MARQKKAPAPEPKAAPAPDVVFEYERDDVILTKPYGTGRITNRRVFEGEPLYTLFADQHGVQYVREEDIIGNVNKL